ncbi:TorF family putative porin [Qipengyuania sp. MTN3-11]|uniref:TorF family putative porin n=1 Tax=Qipengyuania sp. MTN3-11 TaxID=3056557 RepID=UPI0036F35B92
MLLLSLAAAPAFAQDTTETNTGLPDNDAAASSGFEVSGNVAIVTDYRFRGVSLSGGDFAVQGGVDLAHESGFYIGTWASSISGGPSFGELEVDVYAGYGHEFDNGLTMDVGLLYYIYPTEDIGANVNYWEPYASVGFALGPVSTSVGVAYAWEQDSLGGDDNLYVYTDFEAGLPNTPVTLAAHLGYTDGVLAPPFLSGLSADDSGFDYSIGASTTVLGGLSLGVSYVGVDGPSVDGFTDDTIVGTLAYSF